LAALALAAAAASCSRAAEPGPATGEVATIDPPGTAAGTDPVAGDRQELEELIARRYESYWASFDAARSSPTTDPAADFPALAELAAGEQLEVSYEALIELAEARDALREPDTPAIGGVDPDAEHRVRVDRIDGTVAELSGCLVNDDVRFTADSGVIVGDSVSTVLSSSTMALTGGQWKLIRSRAVEIGEGVTGCWLTGDAEFPY
jgi:hypothetical protein